MQLSKPFIAHLGISNRQVLMHREMVARALEKLFGILKWLRPIHPVSSEPGKRIAKCRKVWFGLTARWRVLTPDPNWFADRQATKQDCCRQLEKIHPVQPTFQGGPLLCHDRHEGDKKSPAKSSCGNLDAPP